VSVWLIKSLKRIAGRGKFIADTSIIFSLERVIKFIPTTQSFVLPHQKQYEKAWDVNLVK
jgi:hypothetical protein